MKELSKAESQRIHAARRASERFGVHVERGTYNRIIREIQTGEAKFCWRTSNRVTVFETELAGQPCRVAYDKHRKQIVTFMTVKESNDYLDRRAKSNRKKHAGAKPEQQPPDTGSEVQCAG